MVFSLWLWPTMKLMATKNTRQMLAISMAMRIRRCDVGQIARWSASVASCKTTRCCHRASAHAVSPRRPPWLMISNETKKTNKTQLLPSFLMVDRHKKAKKFWVPKTDPLLKLLMRQALYKCETPLFKLKS
jgi:hypothetical protein